MIFSILLIIWVGLNSSRVNCFGSYQRNSFTVTRTSPSHPTTPRRNPYIDLCQWQKQMPTTIPLSSAIFSEDTNGVSLNGDSTNNNNHSNNHPMSSSTLEDVRLSTCEKARTVMSVSTSGTLCTVSVSEGIEGAPFGSFVDYVLDDEGNPVFLMNEMSMHTININTPPSSSQPNLVTLFAQLSPVQASSSSSSSRPSSSPRNNHNHNKAMQTSSRVSMTGAVEKLVRDVNAPDMDVLRMRYSISFAYADQVMDSPKFAFYRLRPSKIYFVGGFGVESSWVPVAEYLRAAPDILASEAADICAKLNRESVDDMRLVATHLLRIDEDIESTRVTNVDRLGMDMRVTRQGPRRNKLVTDEFRIGFRIPVISVEDAKSEIQKIFQDAWEQGQGYTWGGELPGSDVPVIKIAEDSLGN